MFVRYYTTIDRPIEAYSEASLEDSEGWLPDLAVDSEQPAASLLARVG